MQKKGKLLWFANTQKESVVYAGTRKDVFSAIRRYVKNGGNTLTITRLYDWTEPEKGQAPLERKVGWEFR